MGRAKRLKNVPLKSKLHVSTWVTHMSHTQNNTHKVSPNKETARINVQGRDLLFRLCWRHNHKPDKLTAASSCEYEYDHRHLKKTKVILMSQRATQFQAQKPSMFKTINILLCDIFHTHQFVNSNRNTVQKIM